MRLEGAHERSVRRRPHVGEHVHVEGLGLVVHWAEQEDSREHTGDTGRKEQARCSEDRRQAKRQ